MSAIPATGGAVIAGRRPTLLAAIVILVCILVVGWGGTAGFWVRDDFIQLAYVRLIGSPWPLFTTDHYPVPGSIFRPLGFASLWLSEAMLGANYAYHVIADLLLHGAVAITLHGLLRPAVGRWIALAASLLFALHPLAIATVLSWSNRFDLLAVLFTLIAIRCSLAATERPSWILLGPLAAAVLAALLSKESGLIAAAAVAIPLIDAMRSRPGLRRLAAAALVLVVVTSIGYFLWRRALLGSAASPLIGDASLLDTVVRGCVLWWRNLPGFLFHGVVPAPIDGFVALALALCCVLAPIALRRSISSRSRLAAGLVMLLAPAIVQAPIAVLNAAAVTASMSPVEFGVQARLYYMGACGLTIALALLASHGLCRAGPLARRVAIGMVLVVIVGVAHASIRFAQSHAARSAAIAESARTVIGYVNRHALPPPPCRVVILGYAPPPEWGNVTSMDTVVKALASDRASVDGCLFATTHKTYFHQFARGRVDAHSVLPWRPRPGISGQAAQPWLRIGALELAYLDAPTELSATDRETIRFLSIEADGVRDVSDQVRSGERPVVLE